MKPALIITSLLLFLVSCTSVSYEEHTDAGSKYILENGMTLLLKENPDTGMVALDFMLKRGIAVDEDLPGISHFTNRLLLSGTTTRTRDTIQREIENVGGSIKARTYAEYSEIVIEVPSESLSTALDLLQDVILNPTFTPEEIERERTLIIGEIETKKDQPHVISEELFMKQMFKGHPYENPIDGYTETVNKITREEIVRHHAEWYTANNAVLSIVGNIKEKPTLRAVNALFKKLPKTGLTENLPTPQVHLLPITPQENTPP